MTCAEFEKVLPDITGGDRKFEQEQHLRSCSACRSLVADLNAISKQARSLQACEDPSPRVWNSLEIALIREGLIRQPSRGELAKVHAFPSRWRSAWLLPVAAGLLVAAGIVQYERRTDQTTVQVVTPAVSTPHQQLTVEVANAAADQQLLESVAERTPAMKAAYAANLQNVNSYIHDAEESVKNNPNDEEAQQYLSNAYEQRAMVYEMAEGRSLP
jgi:predicted anti-sigma-YlaC factor YlaD